MHANQKKIKGQLDSELQSQYFITRIIAGLMSKKWSIKLLNQSVKSQKGKDLEGIDCEEKFIPSNSGGPDIRIRIFKPRSNLKNLPVMIYAHGGGFFFGIPEMYMERFKEYILKRPCIIIAPDYRKSFDAPYPAAFNDCYDTLLWAQKYASQNQLSSQVILAGHSAGGGLIAALTLKTRDTHNNSIAFQMPFYPMIDDRQETLSARTMIDVPVWQKKNNEFAWKIYLRDCPGDISVYASPARNNDYTGFPPTITYVSDLEPFRDDTIAYTKAITNKNIPVRFKVFKGGFHGFDFSAKNTTIAKEAVEFELESYAAYYDTYINSKD